ncbi:fungal-specific transcription factor domain-containing protein [Ilyonectria robusta]|uniref:fungal-specific transcription factor domain-containing protein n=1 Tax=Ilyonectria robusta TaxID=1079257 RepID=UPI001E8D91A3|nr:fungal-specific transcription factor domain-containing protein [Ilyonectria robusta]KAH8734763.1 fungal-specific transcription factor domain-containing protein [Ilyonectria robusta]
MASEMKASIHRFRLRRVSPSPRDAGRARSASPPSGPSHDLQQQSSLQQRQPPLSTPHRGTGSREVKPVPPACDRCRSFKKKCSRTYPVCSLCAGAGQRCSYSNPVASAEAQAHQLRARVQWLTRYIDENVLVPGRSSGVNALMVDQQSIDGRIEDHDPGSVGATSSHVSYQSSTDGSNKRRLVTHQALPPDIPASRFVDAYFRHVNRAYPFVDQAKVRRDLESLGDISQVNRDPSATLLYLVMAIGCTTLERAGQVPRGTGERFNVAYPNIIQECLCHEGIESVQILVLLGLYSLFDPAAIPAYSIVGIAARQAMVIGLTRPVPDEQALPAGDKELRHRLHWSIFVLDRMMAGSQGLPVALTDENASVPLPGLTVEEFASPGRAVYARNLQTSRHIIQLRQLEDRILQGVHLRKQADAVALSPADRRAVLSSLRAEIEDWYSNGCLMSPMDADNVPIHSSITWLSSQYYHLLVIAYYPNHFNSTAAAVTRQELLEFARKQLQAISVLLQQRQLPLNRVTLCRLLPVCLLLMHDFVATSRTAEWEGQTAAPFAARDEVTELIVVLEAFPKGWVIAHQAAAILQQFAGIIAGGMTAFFGNQGQSTEELMNPCISRFSALVQQMLGKATCFQFVLYPPERNGDERVGNHINLGAQQPTPNPLFFGDTDVGGVVNDEAVLGYGWGSCWDLDFL